MPLMSASEPIKYLYVEDIAADLGEEDTRLVRRWITEEMVHHKHGRRVKVLPADFEAWKASKRVDPRIERVA